MNRVSRPDVEYWSSPTPRTGDEKWTARIRGVAGGPDRFAGTRRAVHDAVRELPPPASLWTTLPAMPSADKVPLNVSIESGVLIVN
jgi:hypothetical protein